MRGVAQADLVARLGRGHAPLVFDEAGHFEAGDGLRLLILPDHLLIQVANDGSDGYMIIQTHELLDALVEMARRTGS